MSLIIKNQKIEVPGLITKSWLDTDGPPKTIKCNKFINRRICSVVIHTIRGIHPATMALDEYGQPAISQDESEGFANAKYWARKTSKNASVHLIVCHNGTVLNICDLKDEIAWHCEGGNLWTIGIEMCQLKNGTIYRSCLEETVKLVNFLTKEFGIQRQLPAKLINGKRVPISGVIPRLNQDNDGPAGKNYYGVYGHNHNTINKGSGDPGVVIFQMLLDEQYEGWDLKNDEDLDVWKQRQTNLGIQKPDGIPGTQTVLALKTTGYKNGLWITLPND